MNEQRRAELGEPLAASGRAAESAMIRVTNGSNTHKGAIWTLGLVAAAAGRNELPLIRLDPVAITRTAASIASFDDPDHEWTRRRPSAMAGRLRINTNRDRMQLPSHRQIVAQKFFVNIARGGTIKCFPHNVELRLPKLRW